MNGIELTFLEEKKKLSIGTSKIFGNPDVWDGFKWLQYTEDGEDYDLTFICQINCAEVAIFDEKGFLPKNGMLYFFYDMDLMPRESSNGNAARVIYYNDYGAGFSDFFEMLRCDHEGNNMSMPEMKICFNSEEIPSEHLRGKLCAEKDGELLLQLFSFETDKVSIKFPDGLSLCFSVRWETHIDSYMKVPVTIIKTDIELR